MAEFFHTRRTPLSGSNSGITSSDTLHGYLFIEVKHRARTWLRGVFDKAAGLAKKEGKTPVVVTIDKNKPGFLITVHSDDVELLYSLKEGGDIGSYGRIWEIKTRP